MYGWNASTLASEPHVYFNSTASAISFANTVSVPARSIQMHPGPNGVFAVLRWTAPSAGAYAITGAFRGNDALSESRIASIQKNGVEIFSGAVGGTGVLNSFNLSNTLLIGDTLDFMVDPNGPHQNDSTGLTLNIIPASQVLVNGTCGTADGVAVATAPTANRCTTGTANPTTLTNPGPWSWTCNGSGGGTNASCGAPTIGTPDFYISAAVVVPTDTTKIVHLPPAVAPISGFTVTCTSSNPAVVTLESETTYPTWGTGVVRVTGTVVRALTVGSATINCGGISHSIAVVQPTVISITPDNTIHGRPTRFEIVGTNLQNYMRFAVEGCDGDSVEIDPQSGTSTRRVFECSPNAPVSLNSQVTVRLLHSAVNLNTVGYRYATTWVNPCPDNPDALALARQQYGNTSPGANVGSIPWLTMTYQEVVALENLLRSNGACLAFDADLSAKMRRELGWQSDALNNELELVTPTRLGWLQAFAANVTAPEYLDYGVKALVSIVKITGTGSAVLKNTKEGTLKGMARLTHYFKRNGSGLSARAVNRLNAMKKLQDVLKLVSKSTSVLVTHNSAVQAGFAPEEMAELQDARNELVIKGIMTTPELKQLTEFLEGRNTLDSVVTRFEAKVPNIGFVRQRRMNWRAWHSESRCRATV